MAGSDSNRLYELDPKTGGLGGEVNITGLTLELCSESFSGVGYDFYIKDSMAVYGCTIGEDGNITKAELFNFIDSDLNSDSITEVVPFSSNKFFAVGYDDEQYCSVFTRIPDDKQAEYETLILGVMNLTSELRGEIIAFNKANSAYRVTVSDYSQSAEGDAELAVSRLNAELASGKEKAPDILCIDSRMPYESYAEKGLFTDLYELMDGDSTFDCKDYLENVFEACENVGRLYSVLTAFGIETFAAKTSLLNSMKGWNFDEFVSYADAHPDISMFSPSFGRKQFLRTYLLYSYGSLVNASEGTCNFDSGEFRYALEFAKTLGDGGGEIDFRDDAPYREGKVLLANELVRSFDSYKVSLMYTFASDSEYIGFPCEEGNGALISTEYGGYEFSILQYSEHKTGSWEFVKCFLSEEKQMPRRSESGAWESMNGLPVLKKAIEKLHEIALAGEDDTAAGEAPLTKKQADKVMKLIYGTTQVMRENNALCEIVTESAGAYFAGQKSLDDTINEIQNRAGILISEQT